MVECTDRAIARVERDWEKIAGEPVDVECIDGTFYGYTSELGALRLFKKYGICDGRTDAKYSSNLKSWYFRLET